MLANIHATCIMIGGAGLPFGTSPECGVLLLGESGSGKSDLALRLIERGAHLVSDDRTELFLHDGLLHAQPPLNIRGLLEVRGVGVLSIGHRAPAKLALAVVLRRDDPPPRLPEPEWYQPPQVLASSCKMRIPLLRLDPFAHAATAKLIAAAGAYTLSRLRDGRTPEHPPAELVVTSVPCFRKTG